MTSSSFTVTFFPTSLPGKSVVTLSLAIKNQTPNPILVSSIAIRFKAGVLGTPGILQPQSMVRLQNENRYKLKLMPLAVDPDGAEPYIVILTPTSGTISIKGNQTENIPLIFNTSNTPSDKVIEMMEINYGHNQQALFSNPRLQITAPIPPSPLIYTFSLSESPQIAGSHRETEAFLIITNPTNYPVTMGHVTIVMPVGLVSPKTEGDIEVTPPNHGFTVMKENAPGSTRWVITASNPEETIQPGQALVIQFSKMLISDTPGIGQLYVAETRFPNHNNREITFNVLKLDASQQFNLTPSIELLAEPLYIKKGKSTRVSWQVPEGNQITLHQNQWVKPISQPTGTSTFQLTDTTVFTLEVQSGETTIQRQLIVYSLVTTTCTCSMCATRSTSMVMRAIP